MALNAATLAAALTPDIKACFTDHLGAVDNATMTAFATALAEAIASKVVAHITANAVVTGTATGAMGGGPGVPVVGSVT